MYEPTESEINLSTLRAVNRIEEKLNQILGVLIFLAVVVVGKLWGG